MGGNNRHSKDRMFITSTEWANEYGGKKDSKKVTYRALPFDHCGLSLAQFHNPVCLAEGVLFDLENLMEYIIKHKRNPVTSSPVTIKDIIRLNMEKNNDGNWHCPITNKVFTNNSHVVAIRTSGNVYAYDAVLELNIKPKNYTDLITGESFTKTDIITLQCPHDAAHMALRDVNNFAHLKEIRENNISSRTSESKIRHNPTSESVMKEMEKKKTEEAESSKKTKKLEEYLDDPSKIGYTEDVADIISLKPTIEDVNPGQVNTDGRASSAFTSSVMSRWTSNETRLATPDEIRTARWKKMKKVGKKAYVQLQTSAGNLNVEIHCDITPQTSWNFITLCSRGYYDNTKFHRLVPQFILQGGDPEGTGTGGESAWGGKNFKDEFDSRVSHDARGVLSMANSGPGTNGSQFFFTLRETKHLDNRHTVFGKVVGGAATLDRIEALGGGKNDTLTADVFILKTIVFSNPLEEAEVLLKSEINSNIEARSKSTIRTALPAPVSITAVASGTVNTGSNKRIRDSNDDSSSITTTALVVGAAAKKATTLGGNAGSNASSVAAFLKSHNSSSFH